MLKYSTEDMHLLATQRGFSFLSESYSGIMNKHKWQCSKKHIWLARPNDIKSGCGCPKCMGKGNTIEDIKQLIKDRPISFVSPKFRFMKDKYNWQCQICDHVWKAMATTIIRCGTGCPRCAGKCYSMEDVLQIAANRGFKLLTQQFTGLTGRYKWRCPDQHEWETTAQKIKQGTGCPCCNNKYVQEEKCRFIFEQSIGRIFKKDRAVLGKRLELDGYCKDLALAFEYHGKQHFHRIPYWHKNKDSLQKQQDRDREKLKLCVDKGIDLIIIKWDCDDLEKFILNILRDKDLIVNESIDWQKFRDNPCRLREVKVAATAIGVKCLSSKYITAVERMSFQCNTCGREWQSTANDIKNGYGCLRCGGTMKKTVEDMHALAQKNDIKFLSTEYINARTKHEWECLVCNNVFWKNPDDVRQGHGCAKCSREKQYQNQRFTLDYMHELAQKKGLEFCSAEYKGAQIKYEWKCNKCQHVWMNTFGDIRKKEQERVCPRCCGRYRSLEDVQFIASKKSITVLSFHVEGNYKKLLYKCDKCAYEWRTTPRNIEYFSGCPECAKLRKTIDDMHQLAEANSILFLSTEYHGMQVKHTWGCTSGHQWQTDPYQIQRGVQCPQCHKSSRMDAVKLCATKVGAKCISNTYISAKSKMEFSCLTCNHVWKTSPCNIKAGHGCPKCGYVTRAKSRRATINKKADSRILISQP